ncbi:Uncharacterized membrane protein [Flavobacterium glycines]|uniref:Uncharacterized membrane protein n=1 Tax=Flavobacterium glycines TaxID=551990 RepID=A0A1B9DST5_9FLAO|nr:hypothetical protein [Flavobacterium glycines]OCB72744.1 hypothetical protein FBGL_05330 [Flavobacterium glycines]GEL11774.1 hypothetical protein FGL01_25130 [Flavobacterium glycines]SDJ82575.1 Uncharacterized membrane protein [Flavobacterium glycines]
MNDAHLHMIVNHFPIIGTILGLLVLIGGIYFRSISIKNTSYFLFIIATVFTVFSMATGEGAEELVEDMPTIGHEIIHNHEELAEKLAIVMYLLGIVSFIGLITNIKNHAKAKFFSYAILIIAIVAVFLSTKVGTSGGEIRHTEIRPDAVLLNTNSKSTESTIDKD